MYYAVRVSTSNDIFPTGLTDPDAQLLGATMNFKGLFNKQPDEPALDPLHDLVLTKLRVGYLVDYDLKTWQVTAYNTYDFDGQRVDEWELSHDRELRYLERSEDDEEVWTLATKVPVGTLGDAVRDRLYAQEEPPGELVYRDRSYYLYEDAAGYFREGGRGEPQPMLTWSYSDAENQNFLTVEQWGERELEASVAIRVHTYQFTNILPGPAAEA